MIPQGWELVLILAVVMLLFGYKRLPDATRSLGRSMRILKAETKGLRSDDHPETTVHPDPAPVHRETVREPVRTEAVQPEPVRVVAPEQTERRPL